MNCMETIDIINKIIGPITPCADSAIDSVRLENLKNYCNVAEQMMLNIRSIARDNSSNFASVKKMGEFATKFLKEVNDL
jgi:hypothetical protein